MPCFRHLNSDNTSSALTSLASSVGQVALLTDAVIGQGELGCATKSGVSRGSTRPLPSVDVAGLTSLLDSAKRILVAGHDASVSHDHDVHEDEAATNASFLGRIADAKSKFVSALSEAMTTTVTALWEAVVDIRAAVTDIGVESEMIQLYNPVSSTVKAEARSLASVAQLAPVVNQERLAAVTAQLQATKKAARVTRVIFDRFCANFVESFMETPEFSALKQRIAHEPALSPTVLNLLQAELDRLAANTTTPKAANAQTEPHPDTHDLFLTADEREYAKRKAAVVQTFDAYRDFLAERTAYHFGYPYNLAFDNEHLHSFMNYSCNNLGDCFVASNYEVHTRKFEIGVLDFFADLWKIPREDYWGYVTSCGTEGNLHGLLLARECLPTGILYASRESHYSVFKAARYYRMQSVCVPSLYSGEIDYAALEESIAANLDVPVILSLNIGTTVKGAIDNVDRVLAILARLNIPRERFHIHCDGALSGLMLPLMENATVVADFTRPIDSMSVSGHKFMGCPMPAGVVICRKDNVKKVEQHIAYLNSKDTTIMGSRNGQAPLFMWNTIQLKGKSGFAKDTHQCLTRAALLNKRLRDAGVSSMLNPMSNTVVFERPDEHAFVKKWQLACEGNIAHAIVMPNITEEKIVVFVTELLASRKAQGTCDKCVAMHIGRANCLCTPCNTDVQIPIA
ncbi:serine decarboxylase [Capsaspora owczarzaki ATCC 30864]|uniref:Serine decarboxylase n=1 Tax=Capsaspora owczarzaki (strain ATCC 30864) TaxID=595528 RepID=A0A0D2VKW1_CAPO3|nr:serine decarboxylase [Capsaspora owczarzaki ATCC 30864]